jgi:hypothetical protein
MFWRRRPIPELTNDAHARWLRAGRPPYELFLGLSVLEQEQLALIGDEVTADRAIALGYAIRDPRAAELGVAAPTDAGAEERLATQLAASVLGRLTKPSGNVIAPPVEMPRESLAGFGERRTETHERAGRRRSRTLFGKPADEAEAAP